MKLKAAQPEKSARTDTDILLEILDRVRRIEDRMEPRQTAEDADEDMSLLKRLLPALGGKYGPSTFVTAELFSDEVLRVLIGDRSRHQIGNLFGRFVGIPIDGYVLNRSGKEHNARLWVVERSLKLPELPESILQRATACDNRLGVKSS